MISIRIMKTINCYKLCWLTLLIRANFENLKIKFRTEGMMVLPKKHPLKNHSFYFYFYKNAMKKIEEVPFIMEVSFLFPL